MFSNGQNVQAADLNNFSVTTVTTTGDITVGDDLAVAGDAAVTGTLTAGTLSPSALTVSGTLTAQALIDASGASAGQIKFPASQNASADANTLDDYEEGSWTPSFGGSGGQSGQAYTTQVGRYVKIGRLVTCQFRVQLSTLGTITTNVQIQGLPFTSENTTNLSASLVVGLWQNMTTAVVYLSGRLDPNTTAITLSHSTAAATSLANLAQADLSNTTYLDGQISYRATT